MYKGYMICWCVYTRFNATFATLSLSLQKTHFLILYMYVFLHNIRLKVLYRHVIYEGRNYCRLPGKAYSRRQHVWLTGANDVDSKTFSRAILAKVSLPVFLFENLMVKKAKYLEMHQVLFVLLVKFVLQLWAFYNYYYYFTFFFF